MSDPFGGAISQLLREASGSIPYNLPDESINLESIRGLRTELDEVADDHVLADAFGLGEQHTVSGLTDGLVLRASGGETAAFTRLNFLDLSGKIANSQVDSTVTYSNLTAVDTLNVESLSGGQAMLIDGGTARYINMGTAGANGNVPTFTSYSSGVRFLLDDTIGGADAGVAIGVGLSGASRAWFGVGASNGSIEFYGGTTRFAIIDNFGVFTKAVVIGEGGVTLGKGLAGEDKNLLFFGRADGGGNEAGHIQMNRAGILEIVCTFEHDSIHFKFNPVDIDGNLSVAGAQTDIGRRLRIGGSSTVGVPSFEIHDSYQTDRRIEATEFYWSVNDAEVQTTFPTVGNWPTIRSKWYRLSSAQANVGDVVLFMPVAYVRVTGQPSDEGHLKWTVDGMPDDGGVNLEIKAELVTITGALSIGTALVINASQITAGTFGAGNYVFPGNVTIAGDLIHTGTRLGVFSATPIVQVAAYIVTNDSADRSYDADSTSIDELADVIATIITDLRSYGFFQ